MLRLITGRAGAGKTAQIMDEIRRAASEHEGGRCLLVPEQYSHEAERELARVAGPSLPLYAEVLSFTGLARKVEAELGTGGRRPVDAGGRLLCMALALDSVYSRLRVYAQPRVYGVERQRHAEQPSARVHRPPPARAELGLHLARKAGEGQHLGVQRQAWPRDARKLALGLVAVLLRHQQAAPALVLRSGAAYFVHDLRGLARAGPACYESQHGSRPPHFRATL